MIVVMKVTSLLPKQCFQESVWIEVMFTNLTFAIWGAEIMCGSL